MDVSYIVQLVSYFGFPIALVVYLLFREKAVYKLHREDAQKNNEVHKHLLDSYNKVIIDNTQALTSLTMLIKERMR